MRLTSLFTSLWLFAPVARELKNTEHGRTGDQMRPIPVHVHVVTTEIERDKELEERRIGGIRR